MIDRRRLLTAAGAVAMLGGAGAARATPAPRDLNGVWTHAWYTRLERPRAFKALVATPAEAEAFEAPRRAHHGELIAKEDVLGQAESEFPDNGPGLARIRGEIRSSWIVDPPNGKIPWIEEARHRLGIDDPDKESVANSLDNVEARPTDERCLTASGSGAPLLNSHDANVLQIVQTPDHVLIATENNHEVRIVRIGGPAPRPATPPSWWGVSTGHWEGATLVVETSGLRPGVTKLNDELSLTDHSRVVERFTRTGPAEITYLFEVEDPTLFTRPWRGEMVFRPAPGIYEYACHEGNYSLPGILSAARQAERASSANGNGAPPGR